MKTLIFLLLFIPIICSGQAVYISHQPADLGIGLRVDYKRFYGSLSYGNGGFYKEYNLEHHVKITTGFMIPLKSDYNGWEFFPTIGVNYHSEKIKYPYIKVTEINPSFELGLTVYMGWVAFGVRTDCLRWEPCVDLGVNF